MAAFVVLLPVEACTKLEVQFHRSVYRAGQMLCPRTEVREFENFVTAKLQ